MDTTKDIIETYQNDPHFRETLRLFQGGQWALGLDTLKELEEKYPLEQELRGLRQEMILRAGVDANERHDRAAARKKTLTKWSLRLGVVAVLLLAAVTGYRAFSGWMNAQLVAAQAGLQDEVQRLELAAKYRNAQELLRAGRTSAAMEVLTAIMAVDPNYPGLDAAISEALAKTELEQRYSEANHLLEGGDAAGALAVYKEINAKQPYYKDVSIQIENIENDFMLGDLLKQADREFEAQRWDEAVDGYETVRALNNTYQAAHVEERLFLSCVNAAELRLEREPDSMTAMEAAQGYFRKALALRPGDETVKVKIDEAKKTIEARLVKSYVEMAQAALAGQGDGLAAFEAASGYLLKALAIYPEDEALKVQNAMALTYLKAQQDFASSRWDSVITNMEFVVGEDPNYAIGTARQTLYEAYLEMGDFEEAAGGYEAALSYFQRAAGLAEQDRSFPLGVYQAQVRVARVLGTLGNYQEAIPVYRAAVEAAGLYEQAVENSKLAAKLEQAERSASWGSFRNAYRYFKEVVEAYPPDTEEVKHTVQSGEYLTQLANRYHTTVGAILEANPSINPKNITSGDSLVIPTLPGAPADEEGG